MIPTPHFVQDALGSQRHAGWLGSRGSFHFCHSFKLPRSYYFVLSVCLILLKVKKPPIFLPLRVTNLLQALNPRYLRFRCDASEPNRPSTPEQWVSNFPLSRILRLMRFPKLLNECDPRFSHTRQSLFNSDSSSFENFTGGEVDRITLEHCARANPIDFVDCGTMKPRCRKRV
jgi:hypothetical protein